MLAVPVLAEKNITWGSHVEGPAGRCMGVSVQGLPVNEAPEKIPVCVKDTVPVGAVGEPDVSDTVAVQVVSSPKGMVDGVQETVVLVGLAIVRVTVTVEAELVVWLRVATPL